MTTLELIGACLGVPLTLLGVAGGLLNVRENCAKWRKDSRKHGKKGVSLTLLGRKEQGGHAEYHFLATGDLFQIIFPIVRDTSAEITSIRQIGDYYEFKAQCSNDVDLQMFITDKKGNRRPM